MSYIELNMDICTTKRCSELKHYFAYPCGFDNWLSRPLFVIAMNGENLDSIPELSLGRAGVRLIFDNNELNFLK